MSFYVDVQHFKNDHHPRLTIKVFHNKRWRSTRDTVRPAGSRLANFYGLLKTHKDRLEMRPILSATQKYNFALAKWLDTKVEPVSLNRYTATDLF